MLAVIILTLALVAVLCVLAYRLATFALPFMLALATARFAHGAEAGWLGAGFVGIISGAASFAILTFLFASVGARFLRLAVAAIFAAPAAVAGYALIHGVTGETVSSPLWRIVFGLAGGACTGLAAVARLVDPP